MAGFKIEDYGGALSLSLTLYQTRCSSLKQTGMDKMVKDLQQMLETYQQELEGSQQSKAALEKECVIYQSQLQVSTVYVVTSSSLGSLMSPEMHAALQRTYNGN